MNYCEAPHAEPPQGGTPNGNGPSPRITEVGDGCYLIPVPEPTEAELAVVFKGLEEGGGSPAGERIRAAIDRYRDTKRAKRAA